MSLSQRLKKWWNGFLAKMARQNQNSFGGQRLDCCSIDKGQKKR